MGSLENYVEFLLRQYNSDHREIVLARDYVKYLVDEYIDGDDYRVNKLMKTIMFAYSNFSFDEQISEDYTACLVFLALNQNSYKSLKSTYRTVSDIYYRFSGNESIACDYTSISMWFSYYFGVEEGSKVLQEIMEIRKKYPYNTDIKENCETIEINLKRAKEKAEAKNNYEASKRNYLESPYDFEFKKIYAEALIDYIRYTDDKIAEEKTVVEEAKKTIVDFYNQYPDDVDLMSLYAYLLLILSMTEEKGYSYIKKLEKLYTLSNKLEIAEIYSQALSEYSLYQDCHLKSIINNLRTFYNKYVGNETIAQSYAEGLYSLASIQKERKRLQVLDEIKEISNIFPGNDEIKKLYYDGLQELERDKK